MKPKITWTNEKRKLSELIPWDLNPRQISTVQAERLVESFENFGQVEIIAISPTNEIYNGHQRLNTLIARYGKDYEVDVRVSSRPLTENERKKLTVFLHKGAAGEWDFDILANEFEIADLLSWGFQRYELNLAEPLKEPDDEIWKGMPEYNSDGVAPFVSLIIYFSNEEEVNEFAALLKRRITHDTISLWFPERPPELQDQLATKAKLIFTNEP